MILIGVTGFMHSGKTETCKILARRFGFQVYGFADALRAMALAINPMISLSGAPQDVLDDLWKHQLDTMHDKDLARALHALRIGRFRRALREYRYADLVQILGYERAKLIPDFRRFLQHLGTDGVRMTFGPDAWVNALSRRIDHERPERAAISDVRFHSEADWVKKNGGVLWRVSRPGVGGTDQHASETEISSLPADQEFLTPTLEELEVQVVSAVASLLQR